MRGVQVFNILLVISYKPDVFLVSGNVLYLISDACTNVCSIWNFTTCNPLHREERKPNVTQGTTISPRVRFLEPSTEMFLVKI
jgi:hypothetical protein